MPASTLRAERELFEACLDGGPERREEILARAESPELRRRVRRLLTAHDRAVARPPATPLEGRPEDPDRVGPFRILERIGEGGMGLVYVAEQTEPVRRRVALKLIRRGMDNREVMARFESERQALALMDHPHIARMLDAGTAADGRPYFAMDLVSGSPITDYCERRRLPLERRLELMLQVCDAVQHAHQKGVIHRDLKPSNILVAEQHGQPSPKVIDFGIAKATGIAEQTLQTRIGQIIGTPDYMSPEQARSSGADIDTRSDVYALGVLLYELLVGLRPLEPRAAGAGLLEMQRRILEVDPAPPSTRLSTLGDEVASIAARRASHPAALARSLRGELDWITMRAMAKDREQRYGTAAELADDIRRYLDDRPVVAGPPSTLYRLRKLVRRHRAPVATALVAAAALVGLAAATAVQNRRVVRERDRANQEAVTAERVSGFLADMLAGVDAGEMGRALVEDLRDRTRAAAPEKGHEQPESLAILDAALDRINATDVALGLLDREVLARAARTLEDEFAGEPEIRARLEHTLGRTYARLGLYDAAASRLRSAVALRERALGATHPDTLRSRHQLGAVRFSQGRYADAAAILVEAAELQRRVLGPEDPDTLGTLHSLAVARWRQERIDAAEALYLQVIDARRRVLGPEHPDLMASMNNLAVLYLSQGRLDEAEPLYDELLEVQRRVRGKEHPDTLSTMHNLAILYENLGRDDEAEALYLETLRLNRAVRGTEHPVTLATQSDLAIFTWRAERLDEAEALYRTTLEAQRRVVGVDHPDTLRTQNNLAVLYERSDRHDEAASLHMDALDKLRAVHGEDHPLTLSVHRNLGFVRRRQGRLAEAEGIFRQVLEGRRRGLAPDHPDIGQSLYDVARVRGEMGDAEAALRLLAEALQAGFVPDEGLDALVDEPAFAGLRADPRFRELVMGTSESGEPS